MVGLAETSAPESPLVRALDPILQRLVLLQGQTQQLSQNLPEQHSALLTELRTQQAELQQLHQQLQEVRQLHQQQTGQLSQLQQRLAKLESQKTQTPAARLDWQELLVLFVGLSVTVPVAVILGLRLWVLAPAPTPAPKPVPAVPTQRR